MKRHRGRPRLSVQPQIVNIKLRLYPDQDEDLLQFLQGVPERMRSSAVKMAMRSGNLSAAAENAAPEDDDLDGLLF
jgi:hypothetical protein